MLNSQPIAIMMGMKSTTTGVLLMNAEAAATMSRLMKSAR